MPVSCLLTPKDLIIPMLLVSLLAQIVDNFKYVLTPKELQKFYSIRLYSTCILFSSSCVSLSSVAAISRTLNSDIELLSELSVNERFCLLSLWKKSVIERRKIVHDKINLVSKLESINLLELRKKESLRIRTILLSSAFYSQSSIVMGVPVKHIDLEIILESCIAIWVSLGLVREDFTFMLIKQSLNTITNEYTTSGIKEIECIKILCKRELKNILSFSNYLFLERDFAPFNSSDNILMLERELTFIKRHQHEMLPF